MSTNFNFQGFLTLKDDFDPNNFHYIYKFPNGYGASVIRNEFSYGHDKGLFELAIIKYDEAGIWEIDYFNPLNEDVIGCLTVSEVNEWLEKIFDL